MRLPAVRQQLTGRLGREPEPRELAKALGVAEEDMQALDGRHEGNGPHVEETTGEVELDDRILLAEAFQSLDDTERAIVYLRFVREVSRRETASQLGMTEDRLRRSTRAALAKLRGELERSAFPGQPRENGKRAAEPSAEEPSPAEEPQGSSKPPTASEPDPPAEEPPESAHSGRILVRMPQSLHGELVKAAKRERVSLNQFITNALSASVGWQRGDEPEPRSPRWLPAAIVTNIVVLAVAGIAAVILLVVALSEGF
jgi:hypothetical protein